MDVDGRRTSDLDAARRECRRDALSIDVIDRRSLISESQADRLVALCLAAMQEADLTGEVRIKLLTDAEMIDAHTRYSGDPTTTDVLTFDLSDRCGSRTLDADLLLCVDEAVRQAGSRRHPVEHELLLYALHGMLHCVGHDDHDEVRYAIMHAEEDRILEAIGVGQTFASIERTGYQASDADQLNLSRAARAAGEPSGCAKVRRSIDQATDGLRPCGSDRKPSGSCESGGAVP